MRRRDEAILERLVLARLGQRGDCSVFTNEVGQGYFASAGPVLRAAVTKYGREAVREVEAILCRHRVSFGLHVGSSDLVSVVGPSGRAAFIELKSADGRLSDEQDNFLARMRELGAVAGVARSEAEAERLIELARGQEVRR